MKTTILDRSEYDVFFRARAAGENRKRERAQFIAEHSPYETSAAAVDFRRCRIRGKDYDMITVMRNDRLPNPKRIRCVSQTAILVSLFGSSDCRSIRCGDEYLALAGDAASLYTEFQEETVPEADMRISKEELPSGKPNIRTLFTSKYRTRRAIAIGAFLLSACIVAIPLRYASGPADAGIKKRSGENAQNPPVVIRDYSFWELLAGEIDAVRKSGGHIDTYTFDRNAAPQTTLRLKDAKPERLSELMSQDGRFEKFHIGDILFDDGSRRFSLSIDSPTLAKNANAVGSHRDIERFSGFIVAQNGKPESIRMTGNPLYTYSLASSKPGGFISALRAFCADTGITPTVFSIAPDHATGTCRMTTELSSDVPGKTVRENFPTQDEIDEAFTPFRKRDGSIRATGQRTGTRDPEGTLVGLIGFNGKKVTFDRSKDGKISVRRTENGE